jgi:hypothetical protein
VLEGCGDLPTPPYGHPSVREASACAEEGIFHPTSLRRGFSTLASIEGSNVV